MYEDEAIKNKKDIVLDLSDTEATAKICKALSSETRLEILKCLVDKSMTISELAEAFYLPMSSMCLHIKTLSEANLITVVPKPGLRGSQKLCGIKTANVTLDIFAHLNKLTRKPPVYVNAVDIKPDFSGTYLAVEADVDQYVTELRKALMAQIHQGKKVIV